jgi:hypothetical protein
MYKTNPKYKTGDKLRCIPGYDDAGLGYVPDEVYTVKSISQHGEYSILYFFEEVSSGVWEIALEYSIKEMRNDKLNKLGI